MVLDVSMEHGYICQRAQHSPVMNTNVMNIMKRMRLIKHYAIPPEKNIVFHKVHKYYSKSQKRFSYYFEFCKLPSDALDQGPDIDFLQLS